MMMFQRGRTKTLNELRTALVISLGGEVTLADCPIINADIHGVRSERSAQAMSLNPTLGKLTLCENARGELRFFPVKNPNNIHDI